MEIDTRILEILNRLGDIEGSVKILNHEYGQIAVDVSNIKKKFDVIAKTSTDVEWLKRFFWIVVGASVTTAFLTLALLYRVVITGGIK